MPANTEHTYDLRAYLGVVRARKWEIAIIAVLVTVAGLSFALRQESVYEGQSKVLVRPVQALGSTSYAIPQVPNLDTERQIVMSQAIARAVSSQMTPQPPLDVLQRNVNVQVVGNTEVLLISYSSASPRQAAAVANLFATAYLDYRTQQTLDQYQTAAGAVQGRIDDLQKRIGDLNDQLNTAPDQKQRDVLGAQRDTLVAQLGVMESRLVDLQSTASTVQSAAQVIQTAEVPTIPISPRKLRDGAVAAFAGIFLGVAFAFLRERLDDRVKGREELEARAGAPVLAVVPKVPGWRRKEETRLVMRTDPKSPAAEAYRTLATNVQFMAARAGLQVLIVTSSTGGEGKSTTCANLAIALAQAGKKVILVSADLRKPRVTRFFEMSTGIGLSDVLKGPVVDVGSVMLDPGIANLRILDSGPMPKNPAELLSRPRCAELIDQLRMVADLVIIDTPPVLAVADASILAGRADGALFLVDSEHTRRSAIAQSRAQLETAGGQILGVVFNNYDPSQGHAYRYQYYGAAYYYGSQSSPSYVPDDLLHATKSNGTHGRRASRELSNGDTPSADDTDRAVSSPGYMRSSD